MSVEFDDKQVHNYIQESELGEKSSSILASQEWMWVHENILKNIEKSALEILRNSKTEQDRLKAQSLFIASQEPERVMRQLVSQGEAAREILKQISEPQNTGEEIQ